METEEKPSWAEIGKLTEENKALQVKVVVAIEGLKVLSELGGGRSNGNRIAQAILTKVFSTPAGEWVCVRREDLEYCRVAIRDAWCKEHGLLEMPDVPTTSIYSRITAALGTGGKE